MAFLVGLQMKMKNDLFSRYIQPFPPTYHSLDSVLVKYLATMTAYYLLARPVFDAKYATEYMGKEGDDSTKIMSDYSRNSGYLVNLSQAIGRVILAGRDLT